MCVSSENVRSWGERRIGRSDSSWFDTDLFGYNCQLVFLVFSKFLSCVVFYELIRVALNSLIRCCAERLLKLT